MPEDAHPQLKGGSADNYHYFTLSMALNYQRNSYTLWQAATKTYNDEDCVVVFRPSEAFNLHEDALRERLVRHKLALQPNRHTRTWRSLCAAIVDLLSGDVRTLFRQTGSDAREILHFVQKAHKRRFPYLSGAKICNYWLYVMSQYTDCGLQHREALTVAPDTHVIQASIRLGVLDPKYRADPHVRDIVSEAWKGVLADTDVAPIDIHTILWLWSRNGFIPLKQGVSYSDEE